MTKSFARKVRDEALEFATIYNDLKKRPRPKDAVRPPWDYLASLDDWPAAFDVPFDDEYRRLDGLGPDQRDILFRTDVHGAVANTIKELGLDKLRIDAFYFSNAGRAAIEAVKLKWATEDDLAPLYNLFLEEKDTLGIVHYPAKSTDAHFYRALLEILCRAFLASSGRKPWTMRQYVGLAFDLSDIRKTLNVSSLTRKDARKFLNTKEPYKTKYKAAGSAASQEGIGEDRIKTFYDMFGPVDDDLLIRVRAKDDYLFGEILHTLFFKKTLDQIAGIVKSRGHISGATGS